MSRNKGDNQPDEPGRAPARVIEPGGPDSAKPADSVPRRRLLAAAVSGGSVAAGLLAMPNGWQTPRVLSAVLPAHAQATTAVVGVPACTVDGPDPAPSTVFFFGGSLDMEDEYTVENIGEIPLTLIAIAFEVLDGDMDIAGDVTSPDPIGMEIPPGETLTFDYRWTGTGEGSTVRVLVQFSSAAGVHVCSHELGFQRIGD